MKYLHAFALFLSVSFFRPVFAGPAQQIQPWLGIELEAAQNQGITVKRVIPGAPAERAGFSAGDKILKIDEEAVTTRDELMSALRARGVGTRVVVHFLRNKKPESKDLKLEILPDMLDLAKAQLIDKPAPGFDLVDIASKKPITNQALSGKVFILEFWATWCPACRAASPFINTWAKAHAAVPVIGVSDEEPAVIKAFVDRQKVTYQQTSDKDNKVQAAYGMGSIPAFILIGKDGKVKDLTVGVGDYLEAFLKKAEILSAAK